MSLLDTRARLAISSVVASRNEYSENTSKAAVTIWENRSSTSCDPGSIVFLFGFIDSRSSSKPDQMAFAVPTVLENFISQPLYRAYRRLNRRSSELGQAGCRIRRCSCGGVYTEISVAETVYELTIGNGAWNRGITSYDARAADLNLLPTLSTCSRNRGCPSPK